MTTSLLILIVLIELARLVLQYKQGKAYKEQRGKTYCTTSEVENKRSKVREEDLHIELCNFAKRGYEIVTVMYSGYNKSDNKHYYTLFFTKKKIKNFVEE